MVRAKFMVESLQPSPEGRRVTLRAVYSDDPTHENRAFWQATPTGTIDMFITNPAAFEQFREGAEYYIDFTQAEE